MAESRSVRRARQPERTKEAILDAAEWLFADRGYEGVSLQQIGEAAGVSRGTPAYFYGSKDGLYDAVIDRVLAAELALIEAAQADSAATGGGPIEIVAAAIDAFIVFLWERPSFVRLVEREALAGGGRVQASMLHSSAMRDGLAVVTGLLADPAFRPVDPANFLLSVIGLCWFPRAHANTFAAALGLDPGSPEFAKQWKRHVVGLVLRGVLAEAAEAE